MTWRSEGATFNAREHCIDNKTNDLRYIDYAIYYTRRRSSPRENDMQKLSFQDAFFLRAESPTCPFHVASLMIFSPPKDAPDNYLRKLAVKLGKLKEVWPIFGKRLNNAHSMRNLSWVEADNFDPNDHVLHYHLPNSGGLNDLLALTAHAHEQLLDRTKPLWQVHLIGGLPRDRFALYFKVHHALIDGVGGLKMIQEIFTTAPSGKLLDAPKRPPKHPARNEESLGEAIRHALDAILKQTKALPEAYNLLANIGLDTLLGKKDVPQLPFSAPRTLLNKVLETRRRFIVCELPLNKVRKIGKHFGGTINDVLVAICGNALRDYLISLDQLPNKTLEAGLPVSVKSSMSDQGNQLSFIICPLETNLADPAKRLRHIIKTTRKAKNDLSHISPEATEDLATIAMVPFLLLTLTHNSQSLPPVFNTILSNVPGPKKTMYLEGAKLEKLYPFSIVTDGMGLNITIISYNGKLCMGITAAPSSEPNIDRLGKHIKQAYQALWASMPTKLVSLRA